MFYLTSIVDQYINWYLMKLTASEYNMRSATGLNIFKPQSERGI